MEYRVADLEVAEVFIFDQRVLQHAAQARSFFRVQFKLQHERRRAAYGGEFVHVCISLWV